MRKHRAFRPGLSEPLEPRAVPSAAGVATPTGIPGITVILPKQVSPTNPQVKAAFAAFDQSYIRAVDNILLAEGSDGLVVPSRNREAFDAAVERSLETLAEQLVLSLNPTSTTPTDSTAANQVVSAIVGNGSNSLESQLLGLPTTTISLQLPGAPTAANGSNNALVPNVVSTAEQVRPTLRVPEAEAGGPSTTQMDPTSTSSPSSSSSKASDDVRSAFNNFLNDYFKAVQGVLLAPGAGGQVNPQAQRADFDARVNQALQSLGTRLSTTLGHYPATSGLGPQVQFDDRGDRGRQPQEPAREAGHARRLAGRRRQGLHPGLDPGDRPGLSLINGDVSKLLGPAGR